jgi:hypothetical protein
MSEVFFFILFLVWLILRIFASYYLPRELYIIFIVIRTIIIIILTAYFIYKARELHKVNEQFSNAYVDSPFIYTIMGDPKSYMEDNKDLVYSAYTQI